MGFVIRRATVEDADGMGLVFTKSWQAAYKNIVPDDYLNGLSAEKRAERLRNGIVNSENTVYCVSELDGKIIGTLVLHKCRDDDLPHSGEVGAIYLLPGFWGRGFGRKMMDYSISALKQMGFETVSLWVLKGNERAIKFYEKCGFVPDCTSKEINIGKPLTVIRYIKNI